MAANSMVAKHMYAFLLPLPTRFCFFRRCFFNFNSTLSISPPTSLSALRASSAASMDTTTRPSDPVMIDKEVNNIKNILACSICYGPLTAAAGSALSVESTNGYQLECRTCKKSFTGSESHLDLTIASGINNSESMPAATEIFRRLVLIRADIARLPFASSSVDAVHAGAALHCWPSPSSAVAEISRILRPGGVFVASTFITDGPFSFIPFLGIQVESIQQITGSHIVLSERELEELCTACGLVDFKCLRNRRFVMLSATKRS